MINIRDVELKINTEDVHYRNLGVNRNIIIL